MGSFGLAGWQNKLTQLAGKFQKWISDIDTLAIWYNVQSSLVYAHIQFESSETTFKKAVSGGPLVIYNLQCGKNLDKNVRNSNF